MATALGLPPVCLFQRRNWSKAVCPPAHVTRGLLATRSCVPQRSLRLQCSTAEPSLAPSPFLAIPASSSAWSAAKQSVTVAFFLVPCTLLLAAAAVATATQPARALRTLLLILTGLSGCSLCLALVAALLSSLYVAVTAAAGALRGSAQQSPSSSPLMSQLQRSDEVVLRSLGASLRVAIPFLLLSFSFLTAAFAPGVVERAAEALFAASFGLAASLALLSVAIAVAAASFSWARRLMFVSRTSAVPPVLPHLAVTSRAEVRSVSRERPSTTPLPARTNRIGAEVAEYDHLPLPTRRRAAEEELSLEEAKAQARATYFADRRWKDSLRAPEPPQRAKKTQSAGVEKGETDARRQAREDWERRVARAQTEGR